ncbi:MAG: type VI secretion system ImpA family N-terminal domain-containing protein, partial [Burkholderiaceae bacterium]
MTTSASTPYSELGKQPLAGASPSGADVRGEPDFDLLQDEMAKLSSPSSSGTLDWNQVARLATTLLAEKGKDLLVASYLAGALLQTRGLPGLADGLGVLRDLLEQYWDTLFPPLQRLRGRRNALQWLAERIARQAEETDWSALPPQEPELVDTLRAHLEAIDAVLRDKDDDAPSLRPLLNLVNSLPLQERPQAPLPAALEEPAAPAAAATE